MGILTTARYFLTEEREVTKEEFVAAERRAGFRNTMGKPKEPATAGFSTTRYYEGERYSETVKGRVEFTTEEVWGEEDDDGLVP